MNKIVIIFERSYFYQNHEKQFGIKRMRENGWNVELWSLAEWTFGWKESKPSANQMNNFIKIKDKKSFDTQINRLKGNNVIFWIYPYHAYGIVSYYIRKKIRKSRFCFINLTESPSLVNHRMLPKVHGILFYFQWGVSMVVYLVKFIMMCFSYLVNYPPDLINKDVLKGYMLRHIAPIVYKSSYNIITTKIAYYSFPMFLERHSKRNVLVNSSDYSVFIENENFKNYTEKKYIVFIDQGFTQYIVLPGQKNTLRDENKYWEELHRFFDAVEKQYQCEIVVAVHPKARYLNHEYGNRKLVYGETCNLIRDAIGVICMYSTAINYVVLYEKPFIQICSDEMLQGGFANMINTCYQTYKKEFNHKILNISKKKYNVSDYMCNYHERTYSRYREKYLVDKNGIKDSTLVDVLMEKSEEIFGDYEVYL